MSNEHHRAVHAQARQPAGAPDGGQFASSEGTESATTLAPGADERRVAVDIDCLNSARELVAVHVADVGPYLDSIHPSRRLALLNPSVDDMTALLGYLVESHQRPDFEHTRINAKLALNEYASAGGSLRLTGWDRTEHLVRNNYHLQSLGTRIHAMTDQERATLNEPGVPTDPKLSEALTIAAEELARCRGVGEQEMDDFFRDVYNMGSSPQDSLDPDWWDPDAEVSEPVAIRLGHAAIGVLARSIMRDRHIDINRAALDGTTTRFTLEHYDALVGRVRDVLGPLTDIDSSPHVRDRYEGR